MTVVRWQLLDGVDTYTFKVNPNQMSTLSFTHVRESSARVSGQPLGRESPGEPIQWSFAGNIYDAQQHDDLLAWSQRDHPIRLSDHLGRTWSILLLKFSPKDRRNPKSLDRYTYEMQALVLERLS